MERTFCPECMAMREYDVITRRETYPVRGDDVAIDARVAVCRVCAKDVGVPELDDAALQAAFGVYRAHHGLLQPEQIREIRSRYGLGQKAFARLLGWGDVTLARYETGSLQSEAHDATLRLVEDPRNVRRLLQLNRDKLSADQIADVEERLDELAPPHEAPLAREEVAPYGGDEAATREGTGRVLIYADGASQLRVRLEGETVWLTQRQIAELYQVSVKTANEHLGNIYADGELPSAATIRRFRIVQREGSRDVTRDLDHYNLDAILAVGYRVRSGRGTQFRQWATARLSELLVKGFTMDDERIKAGRTLGADYFDELLSRIRDIRSSERLFYQKITDIYATSIDYDPSAEMTARFFQTVQNKMHWAAHGHTAAEVIRARADASQPHMGLTTWKNAPEGPVRKCDITVAKNYLGHDEITALNLIVSAYLDFAEMQARGHRPMHMADWITKLDDFLRLSEHEVLECAGTISHALAEEHAAAEFERYRESDRALRSAQPSDFDRLVRDAHALGDEGDSH